MSAATAGEGNPMHGRKHTEETKAKISAALKGKKRTATARAAMSEAHTGKTHTDEAKARIRAAAYQREAQKREAAARAAMPSGSGQAAAALSSGSDEEQMPELMVTPLSRTPSPELGVASAASSLVPGTAGMAGSGSAQASSSAPPVQQSHGFKGPGGKNILR
ncbi:NUMOD3 domain-containing DNA-binding protein [Streptomyces bauhiniae]